MLKIEPLGFNFKFQDAHSQLPMLAYPNLLDKIHQCLDIGKLRVVDGKFDATTGDWLLLLNINDELSHVLKFHDDMLKQVVTDEQIYVKICEITSHCYQLWVQFRFQQKLLKDMQTDDNAHEIITG